jgi:hypothetical protein
MSRGFKDCVAMSSAKGDTAATCDPTFEDVRTEARNVPLLLPKNRNVIGFGKNVAVSGVSATFSGRRR